MVVIPTKPADEGSVNPQLRSRRGFMASVSIALGAIFGLQFVFVLLRFLAPWGKFKVARPVRLPPAAQPQEGQCVKVKYGDAVVLVIKIDGEFRAFNGACTHLNCLVQWQPMTKRFFCACHNGFFEADGVNVPGTPPPSPLLSVDITKDGEDLIIGS